MTINRTGTIIIFQVVRHKEEPFYLQIGGRKAWMLEQLLQVGADGFTTRDAPGARISHYVHQLRRMGVPIATFRRKHGGPFPGFHGAYELQCEVRRTNLTIDKGGKGDGY